MKYVVFDDKNFAIFPNYMEHSTFANLEPISAGFVKITATKDAFGMEVPVADCYGESVSLKLKSREAEDDKILNLGFRIKR